MSRWGKAPATRGRKTGNVRHAVLQAVHYDPATWESAVLSAYGERADWYRNMLAHPLLEVRTGRKCYVPEYRLLDAGERLAALRIYQRRYRRAFRAVMRFLGYPYDGFEEGLRACRLGLDGRVASAAGGGATSS